MRVLFAVSNDNITTSIVDKYQQKFKEIITNKNVYYFNAIIKELQRNKSYDAIVIGEDLEPISNNNYEETDKFLFEKLDGISDEASKPTGEDIPIIFICSDRRTKSDQLLIKLFGIGIYNAIIGNDRSIDTVCSLINKPRNKKEAKLYYRVDSEDVGPYERSDDQDVSETEIQNILAHYRKIGLNEKKCVESFDRIAEQYNDTQLRIIINFLPKDIKDILEVNSNRYKKLMSNGTVLSNGTYTQYNKQNPKVPGKIDVLTKDLEKTNLSKPVIIPSTINVNRNANANVNPNNYTNNNTQYRQPVVNQNVMQARPVQPTQNFGQGMPVRPLNNQQVMQEPKVNNQQVQMSEQHEQIAQPTQNVQQNINQIQGVDKGMQTLINNNDNNNINQNLENVAPNVESNAEPKRGRGRPKKVQVVPSTTNVPTTINSSVPMERPDTTVPVGPVIKRKRGRPSKKEGVLNQGEVSNSMMQQSAETVQAPQENPIEMPPIETANKIDNSNPSTLPSFDDVLPGLEETTEEPVDLFGMSPVDDNSSNNDFLPGFGEDIESLNTNNDSMSGDTNLFDLDLEENTTTTPEQNNVQPESSNINTPYENPNNTPYTAQNNFDNNLYNLQNEETNNFVNPYTTNNFESSPYQNTPKMDNIYGNNPYDQSVNNNNNQMQYGQMPNNQMQNMNQVPYNQNNMQNNIQNNMQSNTNNLMNTQNVQTTDNNVIAGNGKIAVFVGTTKNGTSFIVNNLAQLFSQNGVKTAILDLTRNKNSYYMFTDNDANLMKKATDSIQNLSNGIVDGLSVNKNLTVFTSLPDGIEESNKDTIIQTLSNNFEITLLDCDFSTDTEYFVKANEIYLVQSMDTFTIQPLTQFLSDLKLKNVLDESKLRVIINKYVRLKKLDEKMIIGGMSKYNEPSMTLQRDLFNAQTIKYVTIPFETETYARYLESIAMCSLSLNGYSPNLINSLETLKNMVYPLISGGSYRDNSQTRTEEKRGLFGNKKNKNVGMQETQFSNNVNDTLNKMRTNNF